MDVLPALPVADVFLSREKNSADVYHVELCWFGLLTNGRD